MQNVAWHCPAEIDMEFLGKVVVLTAAHVSPKFQHKPPHQWYLHIYADHPCHGHWCTPIPSQRLGFALFIGNSLDGLFRLWHVESDVRFSQKPTFCAKLINAFLLAKYNFKLHFLMQWGTVLSDNHFPKYSRAHVAMSIMVAWRFLKQFRLRARWSRTFSSGFRPWLWEILSLNWLTILSQSLIQSGKLQPILACKDKAPLYSIFITLPVTS